MSAEIKTYSDEYVTFQYDDEMVGVVSKTHRNDFLSYMVSSKYKVGDPTSVAAYVEFCKVPSLIDTFLDPTGTDNIHVEIVSEENYDRDLSYADGDVTTTSHQHLDVLNDTDSIIYSLTSNSEDSPNYEYVQMLLDTVTIADEWKESLTIPKPESEYGDVDIIFKNVKYSEQAIKYAEAALEIYTQYFDMKMDGEEAAKKIEELENRTKSYKDTSEYAYDSDVFYAIFLDSSSFRNGKDADLMESKEKLEAIIASGTDSE